MRAATVGSYEVIETVYEGALSVVHRCRDHDLRRDVAVKAVRREGSSAGLARRYLLREARLRALVVHPHVLPLYRLAGTADDPLLVGPWLPGGSLRDLPSGALPVAQVLTLAESLGGALDALHRSGWRHGDVSPGNVLFSTPTDHDGPGSPLLGDLGSAGRIGSRARRRGSVVATPHVSAPEVWDGHPLDGRADLYSVGVLLYHALTGAWPFDATEPAAFAELHRRVPVPLPSASTPLLGPAVDRVLLRALAKAPDRRYPTGAALTADLREAVHADRLLARDDERVARDEPTLPTQRSSSKGLEEFAASLDERERAALHALLRRAGVVAAKAWQETEQLAMRVFAPAAALLALEDCGAASALAAGHTNASTVAEACKAPERSIARLLELLTAVGLLARERDRYRLPPPLADLYAAQPHGRPLREAASFWDQLSHWAATGEPVVQMDRPEGGVYARVAARARVLAIPAARELAEELVGRGLLPDRASVLDVGAGSGVWSLAVAAAAPGVTVTAVDRPLVLDQTRGNAEAAGLRERFRAIAGDWRDVPLPNCAFDVAVLANICHLEPPEDVPLLLRRTRDAVRSGGVAVVVDTMPRSADLGALLQGLHLALRTPGGGVYDRATYTDWLGEAGLDVIDTIPLGTTDGALTAVVARRRP